MVSEYNGYRDIPFVAEDKRILYFAQLRSLHLEMTFVGFVLTFILVSFIDATNIPQSLRYLHILEK
ncbi:MAG: hypothetical protein R3D00_28395 [Bacteroidia bacterium]